MWYPTHQHPSCRLIRLNLMGRTKPLPPNFPKSLEVNLIFRIFKEILFSCLTPNQRSLKSSSTFRDLINLVLLISLCYWKREEGCVPLQKDLSRVDL